MKRLLSLAAVLLLCAGLFAMAASAAPASATFTGPGTVRAGDTITLTFSLNGSGISGASGTLSYDSNQLTLSGTQQKIGNGWALEWNGSNFVAYDNSSNMDKPINGNTALFTVTFKVKSGLAAGTAVKASVVNTTSSDGSADTELGTVSYSATIAAPLSTNNDLGSLTVSNATISPAFNAGTTSYTASVPFEVSKLNITATAADGKATVTINSPNLTPNGTTYATVTVTAENGAKKTYTIAVTRAQDPNYVASSNNSLSGITVNGFLLSPVFSAENTQYVIWLPYETENVTVSGTAADSKASVSVEGGSALVAGADNEIKVICTAEDGTQKVYTVIAKRAAAHGSSDEPDVPPSEEPSVPSEPSEPESVPSEPQIPEVVENSDEGIPWWVVLIVGIVCLAGGTAAGIVIDKKLLKK